MAYKYTLEILAGIAIVGFCALFLYTSATMSGAEFAGSDNVGSGLIAQLSGNSRGKFPAPDPPVGAPERGD